MKKLLLILLSSSLLAGCGIFAKKEPIVEVRYVEKPVLNISPPAPVEPRDVDFIVITESNVDEVWQRLRDRNIDVVLFGLTDKGYENISVNLAELLRYINEQNQIISKYREYYETPSEVSEPVPEE